MCSLVMEIYSMTYVITLLRITYKHPKMLILRFNFSEFTLLMSISYLSLFLETYQYLSLEDLLIKWTQRKLFGTRDKGNRHDRVSEKER